MCQMNLATVALTEVMKTAQANHNFLVRKLESKDGKKLTGRWVAVAHRKICTASSLSSALKAMKNIEPDKEKVLLAYIPLHKHISLAF